MSGRVLNTVLSTMGEFSLKSHKDALNNHCMKSVQIRSFFWYVFFCIQSKYRKIRNRKKVWYGLKSPYSPRQVKELIPFKNDLVELIRDIKFRKIRNTFQEKPEEDIKLIKDSHKTMTLADKT